MAERRTENQLLHDRAILAEKKLLGWSVEEISDYIYETTERRVAASTLKHDFTTIRKLWKESRERAFEEDLAVELVRIDQEEKMAWDNYLAATRTNKRKEELQQVAVAIRDQDGAIVDYSAELYDSKRRIVEEGNDQVILAWFDRAVAARKERRKLLGLYAPETHNLNINERKQIEVKAYVGIDFSRMPKIVDGEVVNDTGNGELPGPESD